MKITAKTTKAQLINTLKANESVVKDKTLKSQVKYTLKKFAENAKGVTRTDLTDLVKALMKSLGDKFVEPVLAEEKPKSESSLKKKTQKKVKEVLKEDEEAENEPEDDEDEEAEKTAKKSTGKKKTPAKKSKSQKKGVTVSEKTVPIATADVFPDDLRVNGETYVIDHDIKTLEDLRNAFNAEEEIVFAFYWTKRHLKQFGYFHQYFPNQPKEFEDDLDLCSCIYVSDEDTVAYCVSMYAEAMYTVLPEDLNEIDGLRVCNGIEFQIYRKIDEAE